LSLIFFILLIGPLIFFHELGHFVAARAFGVGVIRFSIGFGPRLFGFRRGETEYVIGALPLGGYVRMVGMEPGELQDLDDTERSKALWAKPIWQRFIIVLAGPLANLILPLPIFIMFYMSQDVRLPAQVGTVVSGSPAADGDGLEAGDLILSVDGHEIRFFDQLRERIGEAGGNAVELEVEREGERVAVTLTPEWRRERDRWTGLRVVERPVIGITATSVSPILHVDDPAGPAALAGLQTFDRVTAVNGESVDTFIGLLERLRLADGAVSLTIRRPVPVADALGDMFVEEPHTFAVTPTRPNGADYYGFRSAAMVLFSVQPGGPAALAGLQRGDEIVSMDGRAYNLFGTLRDTMRLSAGETHTLVVRRDGAEREVELAAVEMEVRGAYNEAVNESFVGMNSLTARGNPYAYSAPEPLTMSGGEQLAYGVSMGFEALFGIIMGLIVGVWQLVTGQVGLSNLGGPMMIADIAAQAGSAGFDSFMRTMGLISINLGILNLLPIPVLDGGNLTLFTIEAIQRRPITMRTRQIANYIGLALILMLFLLVFKNDIERYWSSIAEWFN